MPTIEETSDKLESGTYFSTIDISTGLYQVPLDKEIQDYTGFSTPVGSLKWLRRPGGLTGSPNIFHSPIEHFFQVSQGRLVFDILMTVSIL